MSVHQIFVKGINFGTDFTGGTKVMVRFPADVTEPDIRVAMDDLGLGDVPVVRFGDLDSRHNEYMVRVKDMPNRDVGKMLSGAFDKKFGAGKAEILGQEFVGPKVGKDLKKKGLLAITLTCALILIYVGFRFDFLFAPGAIIALIHDVTISVGFFAFFGKEFNLPILAAVLTILGYSVNDTIVIYDRVRENIGRLPKNLALKDVVNVSITETMGRTIVTSLTVLLVVVVLFVIGGGVLHDFAFCLIVGVIFGSYSTVFIASPVYLLMQRLFPHKGLRATAVTS
jgi:preprotein translocase subunit SecF